MKIKVNLPPLGVRSMNLLLNILVKFSPNKMLGGGWELGFFINHLGRNLHVTETSLETKFCSPAIHTVAYFLWNAFTVPQPHPITKL